MQFRLGLAAALFLLGSAVSSTPADAQRTRARTTRVQPTPRAPVQRPQTRTKPTDAERAQAKRERAIAKNYLKKRTESRRSMARFFEKITVQKNYTGEYVIHRGRNVTAFLDVSDPKHPKYDPKKEKDDESGVPAAKRVHVLVVPNTPREHIGKKLGATIDSSDLQATLRVVKEAEKIAKTLNLKNPRVYMNAESRIGVGYLHVHIVGEKTSKTKYVAPLSP